MTKVALSNSFFVVVVLSSTDKWSLLSIIFEVLNQYAANSVIPCKLNVPGNLAEWLIFKRFQNILGPMKIWELYML